MDFLVMLAMFAVATVAVFVLTGSGPRPVDAVPEKLGDRRDRRIQTRAERGPSSAWMVAALADARARTMAAGQRRATEAVPEEIIEDATTRVFGR